MCLVAAMKKHFVIGFNDGVAARRNGRATPIDCSNPGIGLGHVLT